MATKPALGTPHTTAAANGVGRPPECNGLAADAGGQQDRGHAVGGAVQLAVGQRGIRGRDGRSVGPRGCGAGEPIHLRVPPGGLTTVPPYPILEPSPCPSTGCLSASTRTFTSETSEGIAKITINRPEVRNAFRPTTLFELQEAFEKARNDPQVGVILFTGAGDEAFCSGGDQKIRGEAGYVGPDGVARLNVLDLQILMRRIPKPIIALVAGYAIGGGHILHLVSDLTIAADNAIFGQTGPKVGSFDGGYGSGLLARMVGDKRAREIWYLCRQYSAQEAYDMGMVNRVVPLDRLEEEGVDWAREILSKSPIAIRMVKAAINAAADGLAGQQQLAGDATMLFYMSEEAQEGRNAFNDKRPPDFSKFPKRP